MPYTGIHNENEFYSHHYLAEIFSGDIQATLERWREQAESANARTPWAELRALAPEYLRFRGDFKYAGASASWASADPVALELAEVSLWLNGIHQDGHVPWFGYQLMCGNSLVGARRQTYPRSRLAKQRKADLWFNTAPRRVPWNAETSEPPKRPPATVYHFLLPDDGMANYRDKAAKRLEAADFERIKAWRKAFFQPFAEDEIAELEALSNRSRSRKSVCYAAA